MPNFTVVVSLSKIDKKKFKNSVRDILLGIETFVNMPTSNFNEVLVQIMVTIEPIIEQILNDGSQTSARIVNILRDSGFDKTTDCLESLTQ